MTLGALWYQFRTRYGHGLRVAWYRDVVRPRILQTAPVAGLTDNRCEIHVLTSRQDWLNLIWVLKSFYHASGRQYTLCIHEDGSLDDEQCQTLRRHFPDARVITRQAADVAVAAVLADRPRSRAFRDSNPLALKVFDFGVFLQSDRMFLLDSDILFFTPPEVLLNRLESPGYRRNTLNRDWAYGYSIDQSTAQGLSGFCLEPLVNSGLGLIHRDSIDLAQVEEWLGLNGILSHSHRIEQTLIALYSCRFGFEFLPAEYDVRINDGKPADPCRHYTGPIRHWMYSEGMRRLWRSSNWMHAR